MKNLILMGSPRRKTSFFIANQIANNFLSDIKLVYDLKINPCIGCGFCKKNKKCIYSDDMNLFYNNLNNYKNIIIIYPLYFYGMPGPVKTMIDRTQLFWNQPREKTNQKGLVVILGEQKNENIQDFYKKQWFYIFKNLGIADYKVMLLGSIKNKTDIPKEKIVKCLNFLNKDF